MASKQLSVPTTSKKPNLQWKLTKSGLVFMFLFSFGYILLNAYITYRHYQIEAQAYNNICIWNKKECSTTPYEVFKQDIAMLSENKRSGHKNTLRPISSFGPTVPNHLLDWCNGFHCDGVTIGLYCYGYGYYSQGTCADPF